jgi:ATP-dependent protease ClpP protease subunit
MSKVATLVIDKNIGSNDEFAIMFGMEDPNFSSNDCAKFLEANTDATVIEVEIRSNGGSVTQGFEIYDLLTTSGKTINTTAYKCNSIATVIFMAGTDRRVSKNAEVIIHNPAIDGYSLYGDRLTADKLQEIADDVKVSEDKLYNFYAEKLAIVAGSDKETQLKDLLSKETDLGSTGALDWGFATSIIKETTNSTTVKKIAMYSDKIAAIVKENSKFNNNNMDIKAMAAEISGLKTMITEALASFKKKPEVNASTTTLDNGTSIYFAEGGLSVGVKVYSDEAMTTPVSDGDYKTNEGDTFTVKGGEISTYTEMDANTDTVDSLNAKLAEKDTEISDLKAQIDAEKASKNALIAKVTEISTKVEAFAKVIPAIGNLDKGSDENLTPAQKRLAENRARRNIGK